MCSKTQDVPATVSENLFLFHSVKSPRMYLLTPERKIQIFVGFIELRRQNSGEVLGQHSGKSALIIPLAEGKAIQKPLCDNPGVSEVTPSSSPSATKCHFCLTNAPFAGKRPRGTDLTGILTWIIQVHPFEIISLKIYGSLISSEAAYLKNLSIH